MIVGGLTVRPGRADEPWKGWPPVPQDGLTARQMRSLSFTAARRAMSNRWEEMLAADPERADQLRDFIKASRKRAVTARAAGATKRHHWSDSEIVGAAELYAAKVRAGVRAPVKEVADQMGWSEPRIRQVLAEARRRGWLTATPQRRAGGTLTEAGLEILKRKETDG
jgi:hypothetical protein